MPDEDLPACDACRYDGLDFPCRKPGGAFDFGRVARDLVRAGHAFHTETTDQKIRQETSWATDCAFDIEQDHPSLLFDLVLASIDACETLEDAAYIAAGPVENMVVKHGPRLIGRIEALASVSPKFRYVLSGIWSQSGSVDPEVWERIGRVVAQGGRMSDDGRGPWDGKPVTVLSDEDALALFKERVVETARSQRI